MKEATGELNMTLVTVLAVGAILVFVTAFVPQILNKIQGSWTGEECTAEQVRNGQCTEGK